MSNQTQTKNQTESEFFSVVGTGRKGVEEMLSKMGEEIKAIAAPNVNQGFDTWSKRALVEIANREELTPLLQSRQGIFSVYKCLAKAATMGLQIGGQTAHAYLVPFEGKATLVVTAEGFGFVAAHGPGAVLKNNPPLVEIYEKDDLRIDEHRGMLEHAFDPRQDRGKLCGWAMRLEYNDGHIEIPYVSVEDVQKIIENYSRTKDSKGKPMKAFAKSPEMMQRKTAIKRLLRKPAREAEGLAMLYSLEPLNGEPPLQVAPPRDVTERVATRLDKAVDSMEPDGGKEAEQPKEKPAEPPKEEQGPEPQPGDLF